MNPLPGIEVWSLRKWQWKITDETSDSELEASLIVTKVLNALISWLDKHDCQPI